MFPKSRQVAEKIGSFGHRVDHIYLVNAFNRINNGLYYAYYNNLLKHIWIESNSHNIFIDNLRDLFLLQV